MEPCGFRENKTKKGGELEKVLCFKIALKGSLFH